MFLFNILPFPDSINLKSQFAYRCFYLAKSYSLAGKRAESYALYCRAGSLAHDALKRLQSLTSVDQVCLVVCLGDCLTLEYICVKFL